MALDGIGPGDTFDKNDDCEKNLDRSNGNGIAYIQKAREKKAKPTFKPKKWQKKCKSQANQILRQKS